MSMSNQLLACAVVVLSLIVFGCDGGETESSGGATPVSMVVLLGNQGEYEGKKVYVAGYLGGDMNIYLSEEHAAAYDMKSSIPISDANDGGIESSDCIRSFVFLEGRLEETDSDLFTFVDVSRIVQPGPKARVCWTSS